MQGRSASRDKRGGNNRRRAFMPTGVQLQFRADFVVFAAHVAETNVGLERRRADGAAYVADFLAVGEKFIAFARRLRERVREAQPAQGFRNLAISANARDDLLSDVATL